MMRTRLNMWAFGLVLGLAVGWSVATPKAQAQFSPVAPGVKQGAPDKEEQSAPKVVVTSPLATDVVVTQRYPCQIRSQRHIVVRALSAGLSRPSRSGRARR